MGEQDHAVPTRPTWVRYQVLAAACSLAVVIYIHRVGFARALPKLQGDLHLQDDQLSWLTAAFLFAYGAFEVPWGLIGDRFGVRHLLALLVLGWSLLTGLVTLALALPDVWFLPFVFLLVVRFLFGLFQAGAFPAVSRMLTDWMPVPERGTAQGLIWMSTRAGGMVIPLLLGWLMTRFGNWQTPLWLVAGLGVVWCAGFWPWFRNRPEEMPRVNAAERGVISAGRATRPAGHGRVPWRQMLRSRSAWGLCLMYGGIGFAGNFYLTLLPAYLEKHRQLSDTATSWLSSLPFACGVVACALGGYLSDWIIRRTGNRKWGRRLSGTVGMSVGALAWLGVAGARETWLLGLLLCLVFFCNDLAMGPAWASCADIGERYAGTLGGAMNMIGNLAGAVGNLVTGYLFVAGRHELLFALYAGSYGLSALCWQLVDATKPLADQRESDSA